MNKKIYCGLSNCPFKDCFWHLNGINKQTKKHVEVDNLYNFCTKYIDYVANKTNNEELY